MGTCRHMQACTRVLTHAHTSLHGKGKRKNVNTQIWYSSGSRRGEEPDFWTEQGEVAESRSLGAGHWRGRWILSGEGHDWEGASYAWNICKRTEANSLELLRGVLWLLTGAGSRGQQEASLRVQEKCTRDLDLGGSVGVRGRRQIGEIFRR